MFGSVGLTFFVIGLVWGAKRYALMRNGVRATGTIAEVTSSQSSRTENGRTLQSTSYYPEVKFTAADGKTYRFRGSTGSAVPEYEQGAKVNLIYDRSNPSVAQIADFEQFWLGPLGVGLFGFLFLVGGIGGFFLIADSDRTFGPSFDREMTRAELYETKRGIALSAVVSGVRAVDHQYVVVCRGGAPGGAKRDFESFPLSFDPGPGIVGRTVTVYVDPQQVQRYFVLLDPLFQRNTDAGTTEWK